MFRYFIVLLVFSACATTEIQIDTKAGQLPLLKQKNNIGGILGFNPSYPEATLDSFNQVYQEFLDAGMTIGRVQIDWEELEEEEGTYNVEVLEDQLAEMSSQGLQPFMTLSVYDSEGPVLPPFLESLPINSSMVQSKFNALMDWVVPMLVSYGGWGITIVNEPDNAFEELPNLDTEIIEFVSASRKHIHGINDEVAVSATMNIENLKHSKKSMQELLSVCDILCINIYGAGLSFDQTYTDAENASNFEAMLDFAGEKQIVVQELGMYMDGELLNSSEEIQDKFFEQFFAFMEQEEQVRAAYQFTMVDWSNEVVEIFNELYEDDTPQWFIDQYGAVLKSLGLIDFETGQRRLAASTHIKWMESFKE